MYYVYVIRSLKDGKHYTGMTSNLERRVAEHNKGKKGTPSTSKRGPFILVYNEAVRDRNEARTREKYLKSGAGREFIKHLPR
jgi:putative endonuclease